MAPVPNRGQPFAVLQAESKYSLVFGSLRAKIVNDGYVGQTNGCPHGNGMVGAVAQLHDSSVRFLRGAIPRRVRKMLAPRKTNIVAYELLASLVVFISLCPAEIAGKRVVHFIDNTAALAWVIRAFSKQSYLTLVAGRFGYGAVALHMDYTAKFVASALNLADGPSRDDVSLLEGLGGTENVAWAFPSFSAGLGCWMAREDQAERVLRA